MWQNTIQKNSQKIFRSCEQDCRSTECRAKDEREQKVEWFKGEKTQKHKNYKISHMKKTMNIK